MEDNGMEAVERMRIGGVGAGVPEEAREWLAKRMAKGDAMLLKGSRGFRMEPVAQAGEG